MIYAFIKSYRRKWPLRTQCLVLRVSASGFYDWEKRSPSQRAVANQNLLNDVRRIFWNSGKRYGSRRVRAELKRQGKNIGHVRIEKIMKANDLRALSHKRVRISTTDSCHSFPVAENILDRNFDTSARPC